MIFLINNERILKEMIELCVLKISKELKVEPDNVNVSMELNNGRISPSFGVDSANFSSDEVQGIISNAWGGLKPELMNRIKDAKRKRTEI